LQQQPVFREGGGGVSIGERAKKIQVMAVVVVVVWWWWCGGGGGGSSSSSS
jgi:hypothetical protein